MERHNVSLFFNIPDRTSVLQQALKNSCSQIAHMVQPKAGDGEEDQKRVTAEVRHTSPSQSQSVMKSRFHLAVLNLNHLTPCARADCAQEVHAAAITSLAELTARSIELFHKLAQTVLFSGGTAEASVLAQ